MDQRWWTAVIGLVVLAAVGCGGGDGAPGVTYEGPDQPGPYDVGVAQVEIDDGQGDGRILPIVLWYPASPPGDAAPFEYVLGLEALEIVRLESPMGAVEDAPIDGRGPFPVVLFSHGNGGINAQSFFMTEWLASHGFIVAAPDHVGNTIIDEATGQGIPTEEAALLRPTDISRTLDAVLRESDDPGSVLAGGADPLRVGVAGHSFGGFTSFRVAGATIDQEALEALCMEEDNLLCGDLGEVTFPVSQRDERVIAALPQAPGGAAAMLPGMGFADVAVPTMIQAGNADMTTPYEEESVAPFDQLEGDASLWVLDEAGHFTFSDMCRMVEAIDPETFDLIGEDLSGVLEDGCGEENIPWPEAQALINAYATDFFHFYVSLEPGFGDRLVEGVEHPAEVVELETK